MLPKQKLLIALIISIVIFIACVTIISLILTRVIPLQIEVVSAGEVKIDSQGNWSIVGEKTRATGPVFILLNTSAVVGICALISIIVFSYMYHKQ